MTLEPGIHDPEDAPWWEFTCDGCDPALAQWMAEAAAQFAAILTAAAWPGLRPVPWLKCDGMSLDGMSGQYTVDVTFPRDRRRKRRTFTFIVSRSDEPVPKPELH